MKLGVFGPAFFRGKKYVNYDYVSQSIGEIDGITEIITGGGAGVEQLALQHATLNKIESQVVPPNIKLHGIEKAFVIRNQEIIRTVDFVLLLWDGKDVKYHQTMADAIDQQKRLLLLHVE